MKNILEYLEATVSNHPERTFLSDGKRQITFAEASDRAKRIGSALAGKYSRFIAILTEKTPEEILLFLGSVYGGHAYIPIDSTQPKERMESILRDGHCDCILTDSVNQKKAEQLDFNGARLLYDDLILTEKDDELLSQIREKQIDTDPIYAVFTSGSTGIPKGVVGCHRAVIDYTEALSKALPFDENTVFGNQTPLFFDSPLKELMPAMKFGAQVNLIPKLLFSFPMALCNYLIEQKINTLCWVVSALTMISGLGVLEKNPPVSVKIVCFASEVFPRKQLDLWLKALPDADFYNLYGPTEATGVSCFWHVERTFHGDVIPCGKPFDNTSLFLLNDDGKEAVTLEEGEIYLRGTSVCHGYLNRPDKTNESFVQNPLQSDYPEIVYKTGDHGYLDKDGLLYFVGRNDAQIKKMGHRIELGELETVSNQCENVYRSCAIYRPEEQQIVLFYLGSAQKESVAKTLSDRLPSYMIPDDIIQLDAFPETANGKIDRKKLQQENIR